MTDRLYHGEIDTRFSQKVIQTHRIPYFCATCAGSIDVPTGTDVCVSCEQKAA